MSPLRFWSLYGDELSASCPGRFTPWKQPVTSTKQGLVKHLPTPQNCAKRHGKERILVWVGAPTTVVYSISWRGHCTYWVTQVVAVCLSIRRCRSILFSGSCSSRFLSLVLGYLTRPFERRIVQLKATQT